MNAVSNEQHFLFDCPLYTGIRQQHAALCGPDQLEGSIRLFLELNINADQVPLVAHYIHLCFHDRMVRVEEEEFYNNYCMKCSCQQ